MAETVDEKIKNYRTAPFDARFPNTNQTRNCFQNYLDFHRCNKALNAKGQDVTPCQWYQRVYKSLCPMGWVGKWDEQIENGSFPERSEVANCSQSWCCCSKRFLCSGPEDISNTSITLSA